MRHVDEKLIRQGAVMLEAERWLIEHGSRLRLESLWPHRAIVNNRFVQTRRCRRERQLLQYGHLLRRTFHRFRRPR